MKHFFAIFLFCVSVFTAPSITAQVTISMEKKGNVYFLPGKVNGVPLQFVFDTGASHVYLSLTEAMFMLKNGFLSSDDFTGKISQSMVANGEIVNNMEVNLKSVEIGGVIIENVSAMISEDFDAPLLLGQSLIQRLGPIQLNGNQLILSAHKNRSSQDFQEMVNKAFSLADHGDYEQSLSLSVEVIENCDDNKIRSQAFDNIGWILHKSGELEKALESYRYAVECDSNNQQAAYNLGVGLYDAGRYDDAIVALRKAILLPQSVYTAAAYTYLGDAQLKLGELLNAENSYLTGISIKENQQACIGLGDVYFKKEQYEKAAKYYEKGIAFEPSRPSNVKRLFDLGNAYYSYDNIKSAVDAYNRCRKLVAELWKGKEEWIKEDEELANMYAEHLWYSHLSGIMLARLSDDPNEKAMYYSTEYLLPVNNLQIIDFIQYAYTLGYLGDSGKAFDVLQKGLKKYPDDPELLFLFSQFSKDGNEQISCLTKILENEYIYRPSFFDYGTVYNNIAWAYHCQGESNKGLPYAEKAVKRNPEHDYSWETLGEIYFAVGDYDSCIKAMTTCLNCAGDGQKKSALTYRGKAYIQLGKKKEGNKDLKDADKY